MVSKMYIFRCYALFTHPIFLRLKLAYTCMTSMEYKLSKFQRYNFMIVQRTHYKLCSVESNWCIFHNLGYETLFRTSL